ncbi:hypothetical protein, partial [Scytonema sp. UIC 10036]|uniref:hypothetical protein n=1 Tax=Scytonema sp. UIC 10036 TaxID=2304196 RepID=UPI001A9B86B0
LFFFFYFLFFNYYLLFFIFYFLFFIFYFGFWILYFGFWILDFGFWIFSRCQSLAGNAECEALQSVGDRAGGSASQLGIPRRSLGTR